MVERLTRRKSIASLKVSNTVSVAGRVAMICRAVFTFAPWPLCIVPSPADVWASGAEAAGAAGVGGCPLVLCAMTFPTSPFGSGSHGFKMYHAALLSAYRLTATTLALSGIVENR